METMEELKHHQSCMDLEQLRSLGREDALSLAGVCEKAGRFKDMLVVILAFLSTCPPAYKVEAEERTLLSIAYNKQVLPLRVSIRSLTDTIAQEQNEQIKKLLESMRESLIQELEALCTEVIELVQRIVLFESGFQDADAIIWAYKSVGDHHRYQAELFVPGKEDEKELAEAAFVKGLNEAQTRLVPTSPLRLSLALNYAVFCYEIMRDEEKGRTIAQEAYDAAELELTSLKISQAAMPDTEALLRLIQKTLQSWKKS
jgi:hypothetical protein